MNVSRKGKFTDQKQIMILTIFLLMCTLSKCMTINDRIFLQKLIANEQNGNIIQLKFFL